MDSERNSEPARDRFLPDGDSRAVILVVDDEPDTLAIFGLYLATQDFEVMTAASAAEALQALEDRLPDLILTDYQMPIVSGLELCRVLLNEVYLRPGPSGEAIWRGLCTYAIRFLAC